MSKNYINSILYGQHPVQSLFNIGGEYLAEALTKQQASNREQQHLTDSLNSENQQFQADESNIPLSESSINWMNNKFEEQDVAVTTACGFISFDSLISLETYKAISGVQVQSVSNDLSKSIVTPEIVQVLKEMDFHLPTNYALGNASVDELKDYCELHCSSVDNECIMEIVGALLQPL